MRISQIIVEKLFGVFDYTIPMNMDDRITIIHGPNGFGKTAILRLINGLFNSRYSELRNIPYKEFKVVFSDESVLTVSKTTEQREDESNGNNNATIRVSYNREDGDFVLTGIDENEGSDYGIKEFIYKSGKYYRVIEKESEVIPNLFSQKSHPQPKWFKELTDSLHVRLIQTQRLLALPKLHHSSKLRRPESMSVTAVVTKYSDELAKAIQSKLTEYATLSQSLDRTFPARFVKEMLQDDLSPEELRSRLNELEEKRNHLIDAGLLDKKDDVDFQIPSSIDDNKKSFLSIYIKDVQQKLSVFDEIEAKIDLFKSIINERFSYKELSVSKNGITFSTADNAPLSPTSLSSGEQHELVLLYEFLFKVKPDSLILIDEPEISLHVAWQEQFLRDLQDIIELASFDVLIATHSPQIIYDRWDLTVELKGPAENGKRQNKDKLEPAAAIAATSPTE